MKLGNVNFILFKLMIQQILVKKHSVQLLLDMLQINLN
jgi:hypothetical protein